MKASTRRRVAISLETTWPTDEGHAEQIIELGAMEFRNAKVTGRGLHHYMKASGPLSWDMVARTGLVREFLDDKPTFQQIAVELAEFLADTDVCIFGGDSTFALLDTALRDAVNKSLFQIAGRVIDIHSMAREREPDGDNSFEKLCARYLVGSTAAWRTDRLRFAELLARLTIRFESNSLVRAFAQQDKSENVTVESLEEFILETDSISRTCLCRGVSDKDFLLWPTLFRTYSEKSPDVVEQRLMWMFKLQAQGFLDATPSSDLRWLTVAQHHGLPTRLLDWSLSPLVAAFFAVESLSSSDGAVYLLELGAFKREEEVDLSTLDEIVGFFPSHVSRRVAAQSGVFTVHPTSKTTLDPAGLKQIVIPGRLKQRFREKLLKLGIHRASLFPDLDGLSSHLRYLNGF